MNIEQIREKFKGAYVASYDKAQKNQFGKYMSHRNNEDITLVCQELNALTVEDYCKWYRLYYLMEDPDTKEIMLISLTWDAGKDAILEGFNHDYYPDSVIEFCEVNNIKIDATSYLCICKMLLDDHEDELLDKHLPWERSLYKVFQYNNNSKSETFHVCKYDNPFGYAHKSYRRAYYEETSI